MITHSKTIVVSTGGTGGHIFPALKLSEELRARGHRVILLTDQRGQKYQEGASFDDVHIMTLHKGSGLVSKIRQVLDIGIQALKSWRLYKKIKPDLVIGFGGYTSVPALLAARLFNINIPYMIHEQNAVLGRVNRLMTPHGKLLALGFESTLGIPKKTKTLLVGNPVRDEIFAAGKIMIEPNEKIRLLIFGGSQGATLFSQVIPAAIALLPESVQSSLEIVMQSREESLQETKRALESSHATVISIQPFFLDMSQQLTQADLVIARSGAMSVSEIAAVGRATIFVPLKIAMDNHQYYNVKDIQERNAAWMIEEDSFTPESLAFMLTEIIENREEMMRRGKAIRDFSYPDASVKLAQEVENLLSK